MKKVELICFMASTGLVSASDRQLRFNSEGKFKMVQLTDLHYGETDENDANTDRLVTDILAAEKPDLVVVTGDVVSGFMWDGHTQGWFAPHYSQVFNLLTELGYNWATTAGNHDSQGDLTRAQVSELDRSFEMSLTQPNAADMTHSFNYVLPVFDETGTEILQRLWFLDTGDSDCLGVHGYDCVHPDQIEWFRGQNNLIDPADRSKGHGFLFMHIPMIEYVNLYNDFNYYGTRGEEICCWSVNTGMFGALVEQPTIEWVTVGHDHNNDYYGSYEGINLAYGRKTGYGCYGPSWPMKRGARVFEVTKNPWSIETWVRSEGG